MKATVKLIIVILIFVFGCSTSRQTTAKFASRENNVCKILRGNVVVYAIFVDSKYTNPWTEYDIKSTLDSIQLGMNWIMKNANSSGIPLNIKLEYHKTSEGIVPISGDFSKKTLSNTLYKVPLFSGIKDIYRWADKIAAEAGRSLPAENSVIVKTPIRLTDRERLIARLRDIYKTDNIALIYFINNYYSEEISLAFDINSTDKVEFSIISFKNPSVIAHEFLHLFGAWDLYITPFDKDRKVRKKKKLAMELFPNEIMAFAYRNIDSLEISQFTRYAIGWDNELDKKYSKLLLGKRIKPVKY